MEEPKACVDSQAANATARSLNRGKAMVQLFKKVDVNSEIRNLLERQIVDVLNGGNVDALLSLHGVGPKR